MEFDQLNLIVAAGDYVRDPFTRQIVDMKDKKLLKSIFIIVLSWLIAAALVYLFSMKLKLFLH